MLYIRLEIPIGFLACFFSRRHIAFKHLAVLPHMPNHIFDQIWCKVYLMVFAWGLPRPIIKLYPEKSSRSHRLGDLPKDLGFPFFLQRLKQATSNLARTWGLSGPIIKLYPEKSGRCPVQGKLPKIWRFPFNVYAVAEASDFKFGKQLAFAEAHHKIQPKRKNGLRPKLGELSNVWVPLNISPKMGFGLGQGSSQNLGVPLNIHASAEANDFKIGKRLGFAKFHHKITSRWKSGHDPVVGEFPKFGITI